MLPLTSQPHVLLLLAAAALLGGGALALITGDPGALGPLALGVVGGWCAAQALTRRAAPVTSHAASPASFAADQQSAADRGPAEAPRPAANGHETAAAAPPAPVDAAASGAHLAPHPAPDEAEARVPVATPPAPLPVEARLQDLAARQRTGTAELRRSIRDVIERLEDEEVPVEPPRRSRRRKR
jgi:hypothetical protein